MLFKEKKSESLHQLILKKYFENSLYNFNKDGKTRSKDFSRLFSYFLTEGSKEMLKSKFSIGLDELITLLGEKILESKSPFPILVDGCTGTGKSLLLGLIYLELYERTKNEDSRYCTIYINLHHYEYLIYRTKNVRETAKQMLQEDLDELLNSAKVQNKELILIIDGADQYIRPKVDLYDEILLRMKFFEKKIVGIRKIRSEKLKRNVDISGDPILDN